MLFGNGVDQVFVPRPYLIFYFHVIMRLFTVFLLYFIQMTLNRVNAGCLLKFSVISKKDINRGY